MIGNEKNASDKSIKEIGGYFGLELPDYGDQFPNTLKFQSGRAALRAALEAAKIEHVILPAYICDSVVNTICDAGASIEYYYLDYTLYPKQLPKIQSKKTVFLYVNYFGLCQRNINNLMNHIPNEQLIIDNSQSLFSCPNNILASIHSFRKFIGVPDGGFLRTYGLEVPTPKNADVDSINRIKHLLIRMAQPASNGYIDYLKAEESLTESKPLRISHLTERLLASIDIENVKKRRRENFLTLSSELDRYNMKIWELNSDDTPLCYPLVLNFDCKNLKEKLAKNNIYIPTYWSDAEKRIVEGSIEFGLINCTLAIPCDQRYSTTDISYLADKIRDFLITEKKNSC